MNDDPRWSEIDEYVSSLLGLRDDALDSAIRRSRESDLPNIQVSEGLGRFLEILVRVSGSRRVLEIGTLGGFSTIFLARGVGEGGRVISLELDSVHAGIARANLAEAGLAGRAEVVEGDAHVTLAAMIETGAAPFDFVFLDAEKSGYPDYWRALQALVRPGSLLVVDNVVRRGEVVNAETTDPHVQGVRSMMDLLASTPGLSATVLQTVGSKGYDGFLVAVVD
jgi:predicted O-methyltransferase YrrM